MSGHLDGPPPGPPDPPYIEGDLGAPSAEEFARRRASSEPRPENPYRTLHARMSPPGAAWDEGFAAGRAAERAATDDVLRKAKAALRAHRLNWIALSDRLDTPYTDRPDSSPWSRFALPVCQRGRTVEESIVDLLARSVPSDPKETNDE